MSQSSAQPAAPAQAKVGALVPVLAFAGITVSLMQTLVVPLVPVLPELLNTSSANAAWVVTATLLAGAVATPVVGRLGDMYGKRRMLLGCLAVLVVGCVVCAMTSSLIPMLLGRTLQGASAGVIALGISAMRDTVPADQLGSATATMSSSLGVGGALGLPAAAAIADNFDWHLLFWVSAGLAAAAAALIAVVVPRQADTPAGGRFDGLGAVGLSTLLVCLLLAVSKGSEWGWTSGTTLGLFAVVVVVLPLWIWWELRSAEPLVDLRTTARRQVLLTNVASVMFGFAMFAMSLVLPQLAQLPEELGYGLGQTMLVAGLIMAPSGLVMMAMAPVAARITRRFGAKVTLMLGATVIAGGYGINIALMSEIWHLVLVSCFIGAGTGLSYGTMPTLIMAGVPTSQTAAANSFNTLMRSLGVSTASAAAGAMLAQFTLDVGPAGVPSQEGFRVVMATGVVGALVALLVAAFLPSQRPGRRPRCQGESVPTTDPIPSAEPAPVGEESTPHVRAGSTRNVAEVGSGVSGRVRSG